MSEFWSDEISAHAFAEPWQAEAFALAVALNKRGAFDWREWVATFSDAATVPLATSETTYFERWLAALETIVVDRGLVSMAEREARVEQWRRAYLRTPHGEPVELARGAAGEADHEAHAHHHEDVGRLVARATPVSVSPGLGGGRRG